MEFESSENQSDSNSPSHGRDLTTGSIPRHLIEFALPLLLWGLVQTLYGAINMYWVGNYLHENAVAAIANSMQIFWVMTTAAVGMTTAANVLIAQAYGARDWRHLRKVVQNSVILTFTTSIICTAAGLIFMRPILHGMSTPAAAFPLAVSFMKIFWWTTPITFMTFLAVTFLRAVGDSKTPMYFQIGSLILTAVLDPILIRGLFGFPHLGLNGAAIATLTAQIITLAAILIYLESGEHLVAPDWGHLKIELPMSWLLLKIGLPTMLQQSAISLGMVVVIKLVNSYGPTATAGYGAATRVDGLAFFAAMMIGMAVSTLSGQNIGAKEYGRVKQTFRWGLIFACGLTAIPALISFFIPGIFMHWFIKGNPAVIQSGIGYLRIISLEYVLFGVMFVCIGVINGSGHTAVTTIISVLWIWGVRLPLATYFSSHMHRLEGIWYAMLISYAVGTCMSLAYYFSGLWKTPVVRRAPVFADDPVEQKESVIDLETG